MDDKLEIKIDYHFSYILSLIGFIAIIGGVIGFFYQEYGIIELFNNFSY
jgi:hypothetical protein